MCFYLHNTSIPFKIKSKQLSVQLNQLEIPLLVYLSFTTVRTRISHVVIPWSSLERPPVSWAPPHQLPHLPDQSNPSSHGSAEELPQSTEQPDQIQRDRGSPVPPTDKHQHFTSHHWWPWGRHGFCNSIFSDVTATSAVCHSITFSTGSQGFHFYLINYLYIMVTDCNSRWRTTSWSNVHWTNFLNSVKIVFRATCSQHSTWYGNAYLFKIYIRSKFHVLGVNT